MKKYLNYRVIASVNENISQKELDKISDAVYASIEKELEAIRDDESKPVNDFVINEVHNNA